MATIPTTDCIVAVREYLESRGRADNTVRGYTTDLRMFFDYLDMDTVEQDHLEKLAARWLNEFRRTIPPKTTGRRLTSLRTLGNALGRKILTEYNAPTPAQSYPHPLPGGLQDLEKMFDAASNIEQKILIALIGLCGLRVSEARSVGPANFDLEERILKVRGKGDKERIIPLSSKAWDILFPVVVDAWIKKQSTLLSYADRSARICITRIASRAKIIRPVSSHDLRATFATEAYNRTLDIRVVQELLGHSSVEQTQLYTRIAISAMRNAVEFSDDDTDND